MTRVSRGVVKKSRRKKWLDLAKGFMGRGHSCHVIAKRLAIRSKVFAYIGRKDRKSQFRRRFIGIINAFCKTMGGKYSTFINKLNNSSYCQIYDRKVLALLIQNDNEKAKELYYKIVVD